MPKSSPHRKRRADTEQEGATAVAISSKKKPLVAADEDDESSAAEEIATDYNDDDVGSEIDSGSSSAGEDDGNRDEDDGMDDDEAVYRPGVDTMDEADTLVHEPDAYDMFYKFELGWSCLSFDYLKPSAMSGLGGDSGGLSLYLVGGSQAPVNKRNENRLMLSKCTGLRRNWSAPNKSDDEFDEADDNAADEIEKHLALKHSYIAAQNAFNTVRVCPHVSHLVATWTDEPSIEIYNVESHLRYLEGAILTADPHERSLYKSGHHREEGFALEWNPLEAAVFASGSRDHNINVYVPVPGGWDLSTVLEGHGGSVEGLSWKADNKNLLISSSCDKSVRLWDLRSNQCVMTDADAHDGDVNVVSFRPSEDLNQYLSGGDDGVIFVKDLRSPSDPLAMNNYHKKPIAILDWDPIDHSMYLAGSHDDTVTIWDLSVEAATELTSPALLKKNVEFFPPQLLFQHMGHEMLAFAKWHPNIPHMITSTALDGFNVFRPENIKPV